MKCCGHETEDESEQNENEGENSKEHRGHSGHPGHSCCCGGGGQGIMKWLFVGFIISLLILFIRGMM